MKRKRRNNLTPGERLALESVVQVYSSDGLIMEFTVVGKNADGTFRCTGRQLKGVSSSQLLLLVTILRDALQRRIEKDIARAGDWAMAQSGPAEGQLELPKDGPGLAGDATQNDIPF